MRSSGGSDGESDGPDTSSTLNDLLADLNGTGPSGTRVGSTNRNSIISSAPPTMPTNSWRPPPPTRSAPALQAGNSSTTSTTGTSRPVNGLISQRPLSLNSHILSAVSSFDQSAGSAPSPGAGGSGAGTASPHSSLFSNPNRSIFTSGQPTSSVSANTVHASMSTPNSGRGARPLAALSGPNSSVPRRPAIQVIPTSSSGSPPIVNAVNVAGVEKDADDPSTSMDEPSSTSRRSTRGAMALHQIFSESPLASPPVSRHGSYLRTLSGTQYRQIRPYEGAPLAPHVYGQGLLSGKFSDITVHAFGTSYNLHRLLLDRAPFFSTAFSGPWIEANTKEMTLDPADVDANITQAAFELALKRIYGCHDPDEEDQEAIGLFAVGCWLEMDDLLEASIASLLRQMSPPRLSGYIRFVTGSYYGRAGDRILASAKAMLCRDGWQMPLRYWDGIPADIVREIVGGDGFYVAGEWDRWVLAKRLLNRRLRQLAREAGLVDTYGKVKKVPKRMSFMAVRFDTVYRQTSPIASRDGSDKGDPWLALYTHHDIAPLLVLLDEGIHYVHLSFEQLQRIREQKDALGLPLMPEKAISTALWMQMELRQRILNSDEGDLELGLAQQVDDVEAALLQASQCLHVSEPALETEIVNGDVPVSRPNSLNSDPSTHSLTTKAAGKQVETDHYDELEEDENVSESWDGTGKPRKFWIPTTDATFPVGEELELDDGKPIRTSRATRLSANRFSASIPPEDVQWASDFASLANAANDHHVHIHELQHQPPMSQTQMQSSAPQSPTIATVPSPKISYTHLPPFRFSVEFPAARMLKENKRFYSNTLWYAGSLWNVYVQKKETIKGLQLGVYLHRERQSENTEILLANYVAGHSVDERIGRLERELEAARRVTDRRVTIGSTPTRDSDGDSTLVNPGAGLDTMSGTLSRPSRRTRMDSTPMKTPVKSLPLTSFPHYDTEGRDGTHLVDDSEDDSDDTLNRSYLTAGSLHAASKSTRPKTPALPPYIDARPTIKTYFKIYTPGKGGRVLTVYESRPDRFNFSQSWGWKSGGLDLDGDAGESGNTKDGKERKLRFMVVVGTV